MGRVMAGATHKQTLRVIVLGLVFSLLGIGLMAGLLLWLLFDAMAPDTYEVAVYKDMSFEILEDEYYVFSSGEAGSVADIWIEIQDVGVLRLRDVTESHVAHLTKCRTAMGDQRVRFCSYSGKWFEFTDGKLTWICLEGTYDRFRIKVSKDGPFCNLPLDIAIAERVSGKPLRYEEGRESFR